MKKVFYMVMGHSNMTDSEVLSVIETWPTLNDGRDYKIFVGRGGESLASRYEQVVLLDADDSYEGKLDKKGKMLDWSLLNRPDAHYFCKVDTDIYIYKGHENRVIELDGAVHSIGRGVIFTSSCQTLRRDFAEVLADAHRDTDGLLDPESNSWNIMMKNHRKQIFYSEDLYTTLIARMHGVSPVIDFLVQRVYYSGVKFQNIHPNIVALIECSPEGLKHVHEGLSVNDALGRALICQNCTNCERLNAMYPVGKLGGGGCQLTELTINHFKAGQCPEGRHEES